MITEPNKIERPSRDLVVLIHGLSAKRYLMLPLKRSLRRAGFETANFGYISFFGSLERHAERFQSYIEGFEGQYDRIHIVAHSMGTAITRIVINRLPKELVNRVVMLAPPNRGTPVARFAGPIVKPVCRAISEISDSPKSFINQLSCDYQCEVGVIAARFDWLIPQKNTRLSAEKDRVCLNSTHNSLLIQPIAARQVISFLNSGLFTQ